MRRMVLGMLLVLLATAAIAQNAGLQTLGAGRVTDFRLYLIWESNGRMSADIAHQRQPLCNGTPCAIYANDRKFGTSTQARVDIVIEGQKGATFKTPLSVVVKTNDGKSTDQLLGWVLRQQSDGPLPHCQPRLRRV